MYPPRFLAPVLHFSVKSLLGSSSIAIWQFLDVHNFVILWFLTEVLRGLLQKVENSVKLTKFNYCCWSPGYPSDANFLNSTADLFSWSPVTQRVSQGDRQKNQKKILAWGMHKAFPFLFLWGKKKFCYWHKFKHMTSFDLNLALKSNTVRLFSACVHRHARNCVYCICTQSYTQLLSSDQFNSHKAELTSNPCFLPGAVFTLHLSLWIIGGPAFSLQGSIYIKVLKNKCFKQKQVSCYQKHFFFW